MCLVDVGPSFCFPLAVSFSTTSAITR
jgi:hypothetical protein